MCEGPGMKMLVPLCRGMRARAVRLPAPAHPAGQGTPQVKPFTMHWSIPSGWRCQNELAPCLGNTKERGRRKKKKNLASCYSSRKASNRANCSEGKRTPHCPPSPDSRHNLGAGMTGTSVFTVSSLEHLSAPPPLLACCQVEELDQSFIIHLVSPQYPAASGHTLGSPPPRQL